MQPIITLQSTVQFDKRDSALSQATQIVDMLQNLHVTDKQDYAKALSEILAEVFPQIGSDVMSWQMKPSEGGNENGIE